MYALDLNKVRGYDSRREVYDLKNEVRISKTFAVRQFIVRHFSWLSAAAATVAGQPFGCLSAAISSATDLQKCSDKIPQGYLPKADRHRKFNVQRSQNQV